MSETNADQPGSHHSHNNTSPALPMDVVKKGGCSSIAKSSSEVAPSSGSHSNDEKKRKRGGESKDDLDETMRPRSNSLSVRYSALELINQPSFAALETAMIRSDSLRAANGIAKPAGIPRCDSIRAMNATTWSEVSTWACAVEATKSVSSMSIATIAVTQAVALRAASPQNISDMALRASSPSAFGKEEDDWLIGKGVYFF